MSADFTRRDLAKVTGAVALVSSAAPRAVAQPTGGLETKPTPAAAQEFPEGFYWGVATSSYQIEGSADADGKGKSIWDTYAHTPGKIKNGHTGDVANDHYRRYKDDVALMQKLGAKAYRFSVAWPRIFPEGTGQPNQRGLDFYSRLVDELLAAGIEPFATLYHWDLPQALQDKYGGWQSRETAKAFADYAGYMAEKLSDRNKHFFTMNEFSSFVDMGHQGSEVPVGGKTVKIELAPGLKLTNAALNQVRHHAVLAQGLSVQAIHAMGRRGTKCGPADNPNIAVPVIETSEHIKAAELATRELNAGYLTVMLEGKYTDVYLEAAGVNAPRFTDDDLKIIATPVDFVGINVYRPYVYVLASNQAPGYRAISFNESHPKMLSSWHVLAPEVMYWGPRFVQSLWNAKEIHITENGCGASDHLASDGSVYDTDRIMFMRNSLFHLQRATAEGVPVKAYFHWSLMDNFEWMDGFGTRFGLVYVDFETQRRIPKTSASYFREAATKNMVV